MSDPSPTPDDQAIVERLRSELQKTRPSRKRRAIEKFFLAALGSIPWVGGFLSAAAAFKVEETSIKSNSLQTEWLEAWVLRQAAHDPRSRLCRRTDGTARRRSCERILYGLLHR